MLLCLGKTPRCNLTNTHSMIRYEKDEYFIYSFDLATKHEIALLCFACCS